MAVHWPRGTNATEGQDQVAAWLFFAAFSLSSLILCVLAEVCLIFII